MGKKLKDNISSRYFEAANALKPKKGRRRIVAYVESYDDIYFWRTVLSSFEDERRYFEVMLPSKTDLTRGKKSVLKNLLEQTAADTPGGSLGESMIACVDADYDYLMQGCTRESQAMLGNPYVFHTYVYAIENYQCYAPSLHDVCVAVTLNDHRIFDFQDYFRQYSEACFPLFVWSVMSCKRDNTGAPMLKDREGNALKFTISDFNRIADPGGFQVQSPEASLKNVRRKVAVKLRELQKAFPDAKADYLKTKSQLNALGVTPQTTYLYVQGHHLFDTVVAPIMGKVCNMLRQERQNEIYHSQAHNTQKRNEMSCYSNSLQDVKTMLKKNNGYMASGQFRRVQDDIRKFLETITTWTS